MKCLHVDNNGKVSATNDALEQCTGYIALDAAEYKEYRKFNSFDEDVADTVFEGMITLFVAGLTVGLIISIVRKLRT